MRLLLLKTDVDEEASDEAKKSTVSCYHSNLYVGESTFLHGFPIRSLALAHDDAMTMSPWTPVKLPSALGSFSICQICIYFAVLFSHFI